MTGFDLLDIERQQHEFRARLAWQRGFFTGLPVGLLVTVVVLLAASVRS